MPVELLIIKNLIENKEYFRKVIPFLKTEYFSNESNKEIFKKIREYSDKYSNSPTVEALLVEFSETKCREDVYASIISTMEEIHSDKSKTEDYKWLIDTTEKFCQERAVYNAVMDCANIIDGRNKTLGFGAMPKILSDAISVCFNTNLGYDVLNDYETRYEEEVSEKRKYPTDINTLNDITNGGPEPGTLNVILAGVHVGKTMTLCHFASCYLKSARNVLYLTLEMSEKDITKRVMANVLNMTVSEYDYLKKNDKDAYFDKMKSYSSRCSGKLIVKQFPTSSVSTIDFEAFVQELKLKKGFVPDVVIVDYINNTLPARLKSNSNASSYEKIKTVAEELRAFAITHDVPLWSATQLNRSGMDKSDVEMTDTAESVGLPQTCDFMMALTTTEDLRQQGRIAAKQLKNRYKDMHQKLKFMLGVDYSKMRLYNLDDETRVFNQVEKVVNKGKIEPDNKMKNFSALKF